MTSSNFILSLLREKMDILFSWGFQNETPIENGLQFIVNGFLFNGMVKVIYNQDDGYFNIRLEHIDGTLFSEKTNIQSSELVNIIDNLVENNCSPSEYKQMVIAEYETFS